MSLQEGFRQASGRHGVPDAVILNEPKSARFLSDRLEPTLAIVIPVLNSCRGQPLGFHHLAPHADVSIDTAGGTCLGRVANQIEAMIARPRHSCRYFCFYNVFIMFL